MFLKRLLFPLVLTLNGSLLQGGATQEALTKWNGETYSRYSQSQIQHQRDFFDFDWIKDCKRVLDVGSGNGRFTANVADHVQKGIVIGLDNSASMISVANQDFLNERHPNLSFYQGKAEDFSFEEGFDYILSIHTLHWIKDQSKALANIYAHLNEEGKVFFLLAPSKEGLPFFIALQKTMAKWSDSFTNFISNQQVYDLETYRKLLVEAGFHIDSMHYVYTPIAFENSFALSGWLSQWLPQRKFLSEELQSPFMEDLIEAYLTEVNIPDRKRPIMWGEYVIVVHGSK